jgi:hypothetical protein
VGDVYARIDLHYPSPRWVGFTDLRKVIPIKEDEEATIVGDGRIHRRW